MLSMLLHRVAVRAGLLAAVAAFAAGHRCATRAPRAPTIEGLARALSEATAKRVRPEDVVWEPSRGAAVDLFLGRGVLFLGAKPAVDSGRLGSRAELYRATMGVSPQGQPLRVRRVVNLTNTRKADERGLLRGGGFAAYAIVSRGAATGVTILDLHRSQGRGGLGTWPSTIADCLLRECWGPLRTTHVAFPPVSRLKATLDSAKLVLALPSHGTLELPLVGESASVAPGVEVWRDAGQPDRPGLLASVGHWLRDQLPTFAAPPIEGQLTQAGARARELPSAPAWPPAAIPPLVASNGAATDGTWRPVGPGAHQSSLLVTTLAVDSTRPHSKLYLVAMDLRRLRLRLQGGVEEPKGDFGPPGTGRLPTTEEAAIGVFGGGVVDPSSRNAMMVDGRLLSLPEASVPGVVITDRGNVGLGHWPAGAELLAGVTSYRQTQPMLIEHGLVVGDQEPTAPGVEARAALCRTAHGQLLYAWIEEATVSALISGLLHAGCTTAVELDAEQGGFAVLGDHAARAGLDQMPPPHWLEAGVARKDFFYLTPRPERPTLGRLRWEVSPGLQPNPKDLPAVVQSSMQIGDLDIELVAIVPDRVQWTVLGGESEPLLPGRPAPRRELPPSDWKRAVFAFDVGHTTRATRYGLAFADRETLSLRSKYASLVLGVGGLDVLPPGDTPELGKRDQAVQLPLLANDGQLTQRASRAGSRRRRGGLCVTPDGFVLAAFAVHDSSAGLALELRRLGCSTIVELDRASQHQAKFYREGTLSTIPRRSETSLLVGLGMEQPQPTFVMGR